MSIHIPEDPAARARVAIAPEAPAAEAARLIAARRLGAIPVQDRHGRLVGVISEHDIVRTIATRALGLRGLAVEEVMSPGPVAVRPDTPPESALALMESRGLRHLPVCSPEGVLLGLLGPGDLARRAAG